MVPLLVVRVCTLVLGGLVPAFASFQALERDDAASQRVLLAYWCSFALLTAAEPLTDAALSWLPLYAETKLALLLWLLTPQFAGAVMVYRGLLSGWLRRHQRAIENTLQSAHLQHGIAALAALLRGSLGLLFTLLRAFWLAGMPARAAAPQPPTQTSLQPLWSAEAESAAAEPVPRPISGRPTPLDTAQVALLSANLEESCAMLLRTALAAQAGNQLLASLQSQSAMLGQQTLGQRKRHSRRRTIVSAGIASTTNSSSYSTYTGSDGGGMTGHTNGQRDTSSRSQSPPESSDASVFGTPPTSRPPDRL